MQPTVSWHREEYAALGVPFEHRGRAARRASGRVAGAVAHRAGELRRPALPLRRRLPRAQAVSARGPAAVVRRQLGRAVDHPPAGRVRPRLSSLRPADAGGAATRCADAMRAAGRDMAELEIVGGIRGRFAAGGRCRRPRRGGGGDPRAARGRLHDDLLQALAVHRRSRRGARPLPPAGGAQRAVNAVVRSHTVLTSQ